MTQPNVFTNSVVTAGRRVDDDAGELVTRDEVDAKNPDKILDGSDILLMRFGSKEGFKLPTVTGGLFDFIV